MWASCVRMALDQHGLITLAQGSSLGCSAESLRRRVRSGELARILPGVYRLPGETVSWHQRVMAACLWAGPSGAASHSTAAALLSLRGFPCDGPVHVSAAKNPQGLPSWVKAHRVSSPLRGLVLVGPIPTTPTWRTLLDLGSVAQVGDVERALDHALHRRLVSLPQLRWAVESNGRAHHRGTAVLARALAVRAPGYEPPESELEAIFYRLIDASDLPTAKRQAGVGDRRCDLLFEAAGLVVEVDGWETHGTREAFEDDRARDRAMVARGLRVLRFTWNDVARNSAAVIDQIRDSLNKNVRHTQVFEKSTRAPEDR